MLFLGGEATAVKENMTTRDFVSFFSVSWWRDTFKVRFLVYENLNVVC